MENLRKLYKIYYGDKKEDYIREYLKDDEIMSGYLTEAKAFDLFYRAMIMSNNYLKNNVNNLDVLVSAYNGEDDYYEDEYQFIIVDLEYSEEITEKATKKMGNTLYYDEANDIYLTGITDWGTSRTIVPTCLKVEEIEE